MIFGYKAPLAKALLCSGLGGIGYGRLGIGFKSLGKPIGCYPVVIGKA